MTPAFCSISLGYEFCIVVSICTHCSWTVITFRIVLFTWTDLIVPFFFGSENGNHLHMIAKQHILVFNIQCSFFSLWCMFHKLFVLLYPLTCIWSSVIYLHSFLYFIMYIEKVEKILVFLLEIIQLEFLYHYKKNVQCFLGYNSEFLRINYSILACSQWLYFWQSMM